VQPASAICVVFDRLQAGLLGPWGCTWTHTPALNRLAAESFVFDGGLADSPQLERLYRSFWAGQHAAVPDELGVTSTSLIAALAATSATTVLVTDDRAVAEHRLAAAFDECLLVPVPTVHQLADAPDGTHAAAVFATAADALAQIAPPFLFWLHCGTLGLTWDAPYSYRQRYADPEDPRPPGFVHVPQRLLPADADPDELLGYLYAYAGQISLLDELLGSWLQSISTTPIREALLVFAAARGMPLGEHRRLGPIDDALYGELLRMPLMIRMPDGQGAACRSQALVQPGNVAASLRDWFQLGGEGAAPWQQSLLPIVRGQREQVGDHAVAVGTDGQRAVLTSAWFARVRAFMPAGDDGPQAGTPSAVSTEREALVELYRKPDDYFEVNEVASRCPEAVVEIRVALSRFEQAAQAQPAQPPPPLPPLLTIGIE
jgi:hypothetical protein